MAKHNWTTIKEYTDIKFDLLDGIARIMINRPRVYNAFRPETNMDMLDAMNICRERNDIGVIILTGAGDKAFCSGGDQNVKGIGGYISENGSTLNDKCLVRIAMTSNKSSLYEENTFFKWSNNKITSSKDVMEKMYQADKNIQKDTQDNLNFGMVLSNKNQ